MGLKTHALCGPLRGDGPNVRLYPSMPTNLWQSVELKASGRYKIAADYLPLHP